MKMEGEDKGRENVEPGHDPGRREAIGQIFTFTAAVVTGELFRGGGEAKADQVDVSEARKKLEAKEAELKEKKRRLAAKKRGLLASAEQHQAEADEAVKELADFYKSEYKEQHNITLTDEQALTLAKRKLNVE